MRIAVVCDDPQTLARHMGRAPLYLVYDAVGSKPVFREERHNDFTAHTGSCAGHDAGQPAHDCHGGIVAALADCQAVVARGMGQRIAAALESRGIKPVLVDADVSPLQAAELFLSGRADGQPGFCRCGGH